jgi:hypothetical protein
MMHFTIQPLEGTTGVYVITAGLESQPIIRSQVNAPTALEAIAAFRAAISALTTVSFPEVTCS